MEVAKGWTILYGGSRKGSYLTIEKDDMKIQATVMAWLDEDFQKVPRKKAKYMMVRRWSYGQGDDLPQWFAVEIDDEKLGRSGLRGGRTA